MPPEAPVPPHPSKQNPPPRPKAKSDYNNYSSILNFTAEAFADIDATMITASVTIAAYKLLTCFRTANGMIAVRRVVNPILSRLANSGADRSALPPAILKRAEDAKSWRPRQA